MLVDGDDSAAARKPLQEAAAALLVLSGQAKSWILRAATGFLEELRLGLLALNSYYALN